MNKNANKAAARTPRKTTPVETDRTNGMVHGFAVAYGGPTLSRTQAGFINSVPSLAADQLLVGMLANQIEEKLAYNRDQGRSGWHTEATSSDELRADLKKLVAKGDYIDAAIVSGMILLREQMALPA